MKRKLRKTEKKLLYAAGIVVVMILVQTILIGPLYTDTDALAKSVGSKRGELQNIVNSMKEYVAIEDKIKQYQDIIERRPSGFSLKTFISKLEQTQNFRSNRIYPENVTFPGTDYEKTRIKYVYTKKTLPEIMGYLYEIEDPLNAMIIEYLSFKISDDGKTFDMEITLTVVTAAK